jgi:extradiol dioxygenase family protein
VAVHRLGSLSAGESASVTVDMDATGKQLVQTLAAGAAQPDDNPENNRAVMSTPVTH